MSPLVAMEGRWIKCEFVQNSRSGKTKIFRVSSMRDEGVVLGEIRWYGPWRQYVFFPLQDTLFERSCLSDLARFLADLMAEKAG